MADEILRANVITLTKVAYAWLASIGPDAGGLSCYGASPLVATARLMQRCEELGWCFDESWIPRGNLSV